MAEVDAAFRAIGHLILIPYYLVVAVNMAGKMMYDRGVVYASSSRKDAEEHARKLAAEGAEVVILKTDKASVLERIKSGANNYKALQNRVGQGEITKKNQNNRNAYQNNLIMAAYGNNDNSPNEENAYGNPYEYRDAYDDYKSGIETELRMPKNSLDLSFNQYKNLVKDPEALMKYREDLLERGYYIPSPATTIVATNSENENKDAPKGGRRSKRLTKRSTKRRNGNRKSSRR